MSITIKGVTSGGVDLKAPDTGSNTTVTLPSATGTLLPTDGNGSALTNLTSANLVGALPALDGSALTNLPAGGVDGIVSSANANAITIDSSENVGIGVTTPLEVLHISEPSSLADTTLLIDEVNGNNAAIRLQSNRDNSSVYRGSNIFNYGRGNGDTTPDVRSNTIDMTSLQGTSAGKIKGQFDFYVANDTTGANLNTLSLTSDGRGLSQFTAKAWVNFNGTGTVSIRDSHNISSVVDNGGGNYSPTYINAMANSNYTVTGNADGPGAWYGWLSVRGHATGSCQVHGVKASCNCATDAGQMDVIIFGD